MQPMSQELTNANNTNNLSTNIKSQKNLKKPKNKVGTEAKEWRKNSLATQQKQNERPVGKGHKSDSI